LLNDHYRTLIEKIIKFTFHRIPDQWIQTTLAEETMQRRKRKRRIENSEKGFTPTLDRGQIHPGKTRFKQFDEL